MLRGGGTNCSCDYQKGLCVGHWWLDQSHRLLFETAIATVMMFWFVAPLYALGHATAVFGLAHGGLHLSNTDGPLWKWGPHEYICVGACRRR